jgi:hypothetical protein
MSHIFFSCLVRKISCEILDETDLKFPAFMYRMPHSGVHQWCTVQTVCSDRIPCCRERVIDKRPQMPLQCLWKCYVQQKHCWLLGEENDNFWKKESRAPCFALLTLSLHSCYSWNAVACWCLHWITCQQIALSLSISKGSDSHIIRYLGCLKVCMR